MLVEQTPNRRFRITGVGTSTAGIFSTGEGDSLFGRALFVPQLGYNLVSVGSATDHRLRIRCDTKQEDAIYVEDTHGFEWRFVRAKSPHALYSASICLNCCSPIMAMPMDVISETDDHVQIIDLEAQSFRVGQRVEARYKSRRNYFPGRITTVHPPSSARSQSLYDIHYDDGDKEKRVAGNLIRALGKVILRRELGDRVDESRLEKAIEARRLHEFLGHASVSSILPGLQTVYKDLGLKESDFQYADAHLGKCLACVAGKKTHRASPADSLVAIDPGQFQHCDIIIVQQPFGKRTGMLFATDDLTNSKFLKQMGYPWDSDDLYDAIVALVARYRMKNLQVRIIGFDRESTMRPCATKLGLLAIELRQPGAGQHEKTLEASARQLRDKARSIKASVEFDTPACLNTRLLSYTVKRMNQTPNHKTGRSTPEEIIDRRDFRILPHVKWGAVGMFVEPARPTGQLGSRPSARTGVVVDVDLQSVNGTVVEVFFPNTETFGFRETGADQVTWLDKVPSSFITSMNSIAKSQNQGTSYLMLNAEGQLFPESDHSRGDPDFLDQAMADEIYRARTNAIIQEEALERRRHAATSAARAREREETADLLRFNQEEAVLDLDVGAPTVPDTLYQQVYQGGSRAERNSSRDSRMASRGADTATNSSSRHPAERPSGQLQTERPSGQSPAPESPQDPAETKDPSGRSSAERPMGQPLASVSPLDPTSVQALNQPSRLVLRSGSAPALLTTQASPADLATVLLAAKVATALGPIRVCPSLSESSSEADIYTAGLIAVDNITCRGGDLLTATKLELIALTNIAIRDVIKTEEGRDKFKSEIKQFVDFDAIEPVHYDQLSALELQNICPSYVFGKVKSDGSLKVRNVMRGDMVKHNAFQNNSSPCVRQQSLFSALGIAGAAVGIDEDYGMAAADITAAYLTTDYPRGAVPIIFEFREPVKSALLSLRPEWKSFDTAPRECKGAMYYQARKAVYGLLSAGLLFNRKLNAVLTSQISLPGGRRLVGLKSDPCVYLEVTAEEAAQRAEGVPAPPGERHNWQSDISAMDTLERGMEGQAGNAEALVLTLQSMREKGISLPNMICTWVDDLLVIGSMSKFILRFIAELKRNFPSGVRASILSKESPLEYVSLSIRINPEGHGIILDQEKMIEKMGISFNISTAEHREYPCQADILERNSNAERLSPKDTTLYQSALMSALFVSRYTRPDALFANVILTLSMSSPTVQDMVRLRHLLGYLLGTKDYCMLLNPDDLQMCAWVDASYAAHSDATGQHGYIVGFKDMGGIMAVRSHKQSLVSRSSSETELIGLHYMLPSLSEGVELFDELGLQQETVDVFEDNGATRRWTEIGADARKRSRHMNVRFFYAKQQQDAGVMRVVWCPSRLMIADSMTKPTFGRTYKIRRMALLGWGILSDAEFDAQSSSARISGQRGVRARLLM